MFRTCFTRGFSSREATGGGSALGRGSAASCLCSIPQSHSRVLSSLELPLASAAPGRSREGGKGEPEVPGALLVCCSHTKVVSASSSNKQMNYTNKNIKNKSITRKKNIPNSIHNASNHQNKTPPINKHKTKKINLTMNSISQIIHNYKTYTTIKQTKQKNPSNINNNNPNINIKNF